MERLDPDQFRAKLQAAVKAAGGVRALSREVGISAQYISDVLLEKCPAGNAIARALGYERRVEYVRRSG